MKPRLRLDKTECHQCKAKYLAEVALREREKRKWKQEVQHILSTEEIDYGNSDTTTNESTPDQPGCSTCDRPAPGGF